MIIDIQLIIDTDLLKRNYPVPDDEPERSTRIGEDCVYLIVEGRGGGVHRGKRRLAFRVDAGDVVRIFGASGSNNFEDAVLIHDITHVAGADVLGDLERISIIRDSIVPCEGPDALPGVVVEQRSWCHQGTVVALGTGKAIAAGSYAGRARLLRGVVHLRPEDSYQRLFGLEHPGGGRGPAVSWSGSSRRAELDHAARRCRTGSGGRVRGSLRDRRQAWRGRLRHRLRGPPAQHRAAGRVEDPAGRRRRCPADRHASRAVLARGAPLRPAPPPQHRPARRHRTDGGRDALHRVHVRARHEPRRVARGRGRWRRARPAT